jgi:hypothetical protein
MKKIYVVLKHSSTFFSQKLKFPEKLLIKKNKSYVTCEQNGVGFHGRFVDNFFWG